MEKRMDLISVIIPAYNSGEYISRCIQSIVSQSYSCLEIIIVDDGSSDGTAEICDEWAERDNRIRVIHQRNSGISEARNAGLSCMTGDIVAFIDSDDSIHKDCFRYLLSAMKSGEYDMAACHFISTWDKDFLPDINYKNDFPVKIFSAEDWFEGLLSVPIDKFRNTSLPYETIWGKLYKKSVVEDLTFENIWSEDAEYNSRLYTRLNKSVVVSLPLYVWLQRKDSAHRSDPLSDSYSRILCACKIYENIPENFAEAKADALKRVWLGVLSTRYLVYGSGSKKDCTTVLNKIKEKAGPLIRPLKENIYVSAGFKAAMLAFWYMPFTYNLFRWALEQRARVMGRLSRKK